MNMDAAGRVGEGSLVAKLPHQFMDSGDIFVGADGADQLGFVGSIGSHFLTVFFLLWDDAPVKGELPLPTLGIGGGEGFVIGAQVPALPAENDAAT